MVPTEGIGKLKRVYRRLPLRVRSTVRRVLTRNRYE
jgi:hypothetical protein